MSTTWDIAEFPPGLRHKPTVIGEYEDGSDEWLDARTKGIGASDTASILGASGAFSTCLQVWAQKIGIEPAEEISDRLAELFHFGHKMEPLIADELRERTGYEVRGEPRTLAHPDQPFIRANLDGWVCVDGVWGPFEAKNSSAYVLDQWAEEAPIKHQVQVQHQMYVAGAEISVIATILGGNQFLWTTVDRNDKFIDAMVSKLKEFWLMVECDVMPAAGDLDLGLVKSLVTTNPDLTTVLPFEALHERLQIEGAKEKIKTWETLKRTAEVKMWEHLGDAMIGEFPDNSGQVRVIRTKSGGKYLRFKEHK